MRTTASLATLAVGALLLAGCAADLKSVGAAPAPEPPPSSPAPVLGPKAMPAIPAAAPVELARSFGDTFATVQIPRFGAEYAMPVHEGIEPRILDRDGFGHFPDSAVLGGEGNFALAGHRTFHSAPLYDIDLLETGDPIVVQTETGTFTYEVIASEIVTPDQMRVVSSDPGHPDVAADSPLLTFVACHPKGSTQYRWITYAELVEAQASTR